MGPLTGYDYFLQNALKYGWVVPQGAIIMWSGLIADIPSGWAFCNGANNTPDLRDKFIVGGKEDSGGVVKSNVEGSLKQTGGTLGHTHSLSMDGHTHTFTGDGHAHSNQNSIEVDSGYGYFAWDGNYSDTFSTAATGTTDTGTASGNADNTNHVPPYYALAYIMKT